MCVITMGGVIVVGVMMKSIEWDWWPDWLSFVLVLLGISFFLFPITLEPLIERYFESKREEYEKQVRRIICPNCGCVGTLEMHTHENFSENDNPLPPYSPPGYLLPSRRSFTRYRHYSTVCINCDYAEPTMFSRIVERLESGADGFYYKDEDEDSSIVWLRSMIKKIRTGQYKVK